MATACPSCGAEHAPGARFLQRVRHRAGREPGAEPTPSTSEAVGLLEKAVERQHDLRRTFEAACLELELARALEAAGRSDEAQAVRARADAVLVPLGCVNPF